MLVLRRKPGEGFTIGADTHVVNLGNGRIGIDAPRDILILRDELHTERYGETPQETRDTSRQREMGTSLLGRYGE